MSILLLILSFRCPAPQVFIYLCFSKLLTGICLSLFINNYLVFHFCVKVWMPYFGSEPGSSSARPQKSVCETQQAKTTTSFVQRLETVGSEKRKKRRNMRRRTNSSFVSYFFVFWFLFTSCLRSPSNVTASATVLVLN